MHKKTKILVSILFFCFCVISHYQLNATYSDDGLTRKLARRYIASVLFNIPLDQIIAAGDNEIVNCDYNDWAEPADYEHGYEGGHGGVDMQTVDVAFEETVDRNFYSLTEGVVIAADQDVYKTIAIYDSINKRTILYLHARSVFVSMGDTIRFGDKLGIQGNSGMNTGNLTTAEHVHFEIQPGRATGPACGADCSIDPVNILYEIIVNTPLWDVQDDKLWCYRYIYFLYGLGIISVNQDGRFRPGDPVNRFEFIEMVIRALEVEKGGHLFTFCINMPSAWNCWDEYIMDAYIFTNLNVSPYEHIAFWDTNSSVNFLGGITRQEAARIVRNALRLPRYVYPPGTTYIFNDVPIITTYSDWINKLWEVGVIHGFVNKNFLPNQVLNRAEAACMIYNMLKYKGYINENNI